MVVVDSYIDRPELTPKISGCILTVYNGTAHYRKIRKRERERENLTTNMITMIAMIAMKSMISTMMMMIIIILIIVIIVMMLMLKTTTAYT